MLTLRSLTLITISVFLLLPVSALAALDESTTFSHSNIKKVGKGWVEVTENGDQAIQDLTAYCINCHGDSKEEPTDRTDGSTSGVHSHPVDCTYPPNGADLVPIAELDKRMLLIDGKMTCITCHSHDVADYRLIIPQASGGLCIACHRK